MRAPGHFKNLFQRPLKGDLNGRDQNLELQIEVQTEKPGETVGEPSEQINDEGEKSLLKIESISLQEAIKRRAFQCD